MKRYQVFISSTYEDLVSTRYSTIMSLLSSDYIPCGMEVFPASSEEQFAYIKRMLDICDYYILILAGRYGTIADNGLSYTEMEYNYALEQGIPILAFLHKNPGNIPIKYSEKSSELHEKLLAFRKRVEKERLCKFWQSPEDLQAKILLSLFDAQKTHPRPGWTRLT